MARERGESARRPASAGGARLAGSRASTALASTAFLLGVGVGYLLRGVAAADPVHAAPERARAGAEREAAEPGATPAADLELLTQLGYLGGVVEATDGGAGVVRHEAGRACPGYNLLVSGHAPELLLVDMEGRLLHRWSCSFDDVWPDRPIPENWAPPDFFRRARLLPDGGALVVFEGFGLVRLDADSEVVWAFDGLAHHDLDLGADGEIYVLTRKVHAVPQVRPHPEYFDDYITKLDPETGAVLAEVSLVECFDASPFRAILDRQRDWRDIFHTNTLAYLDGGLAHRSPAFARGNLLVSLLRDDLLAAVDFDRRTVVWTLAGPWRLQHQPEPLDDGNLLLFDNQGLGPGHSRVLELDPLTGEVVWSYSRRRRNAFFSRNCGSVARLPNGNTLVTESNKGRAFELTPDEEVVWTFVNPYRAANDEELIANLFEVVRLPADLPLDWLR